MACPVIDALHTIPMSFMSTHWTTQADSSKQGAPGKLAFAAH
jgi:hypothetical protein